MGAGNFHERADELARKVERHIEETQRFLDSLPDFEERSDRSQKMQEVMEGFDDQ